MIVNMAQLYFKKKTKGIFSLVELISVETGLAGIISFLYYTIGLPEHWRPFSAALTCVLFSICAIALASSIYQEYAKERKINLFAALAVLVTTAACVVSFTCLDSFLL